TAVKHSPRFRPLPLDLGAPRYQAACRETEQCVDDDAGNGEHDEQRPDLLRPERFPAEPEPRSDPAIRGHDLDGDCHEQPDVERNAYNGEHDGEAPRNDHAPQRPQRLQTEVACDLEVDRTQYAHTGERVDE